MKKPATFPLTYLCSLLTIALGVMLYLSGASCQPAGQEPELVAQPTVWVEAVFVELDRGVTRHIETELGFKLSPPDGKAILSAQEKDKLCSLIAKTNDARIIASLTVLTLSGQQAQSEDVEEVIFPTEYDTETINITGSPGSVDLIPGEVFMVTPGNWETRGVGIILNVTPMVSGDGKMITLVLTPEVTDLVKWINYGTETYPIRQPVFRTWTKTVTVTIPDGSSLVLKELPTRPLGGTQAEVAEPPIQRKEEERDKILCSSLRALHEKTTAHLKQLKAAEADLRRMRERFTLDERDRPIQYQRLELYLQKRDLVTAEIAKLKAYVNRLDEMTAEERVNATQDNPTIYQLSRDVAMEEAALDGLLEQYGAEHPEVRGRKKRVAELKEKLQAHAKGILKSKKVELASLEAQEKQLRQSIDSLEKEVAETHKAYTDYTEMKRKIELKKAVLQVLEESLLTEEPPRRTEEKRPAKKPVPEQQEILRKLNTVLPEIKLEDASLKDVVNFFSRECDVNIVIDPVVFQAPFPGAVMDTGVTVNLKNVPLKEALKFILRYKNLKYLVEDYAILIVPVDFAPPESLETEIFRFPELAGTESESGHAIQDFLRLAGIPWPKGSNIAFDRSTGTLIVTNTPTNMVLVRQLIPLGEPAYRVEKHPEHTKTLLTVISARIVE